MTTVVDYLFSALHLSFCLYGLLKPILNYEVKTSEHLYHSASLQESAKFILFEAQRLKPSTKP